MDVQPLTKRKLLVGMLLISCSFSALSSVTEEPLDSQSQLNTQTSNSLDIRDALETRIKVGVNQMLQEPSWQDRMNKAVKVALVEQAAEEKDKKEIIALIMEELKTNGPSKKENIALNKLPKEELKDTLNSIVQKTSVDLNQQVSEYRETIKKAAIADRKAENAKLAKNEPKKRSKSVKGWIYVGQFINKSWTEKLLNVDVGLPKKGKDYLLKFSANMRDSLPSKKLGMSNVITSLTSGDKIKVLNVHPSGSKGHYWALVEKFTKH